MELNNAVVVITGAAQGLGLEFARMASSHHAKVAILDMNAEAMTLAVDECFKSGASDAKSYSCNVANANEVQTVFQQIEKDLGSIAVLINNAGITRDAMLLKVDKETGKVVRTMSDDQWQAVIDVNLTGTFNCGREAAVRMVESKTEGVIINISSINRAGAAGQTNYSATKAAVEAMAVTWSKELIKYGIRSASIAPGYIGTEMVLSMKPEALEKIAAGIPAKRLGKPYEIAKTAEFIIQNNYVSGRCFEVDGGLRQ